MVYDNFEYTDRNIDKLKQLLELVIAHIQKAHKGLHFENDQQKERFIDSLAQALLKNRHNCVQHGEILQPKFINQLRLILATKPLLKLEKDHRFDKELMEKLCKLLKSEILKKKGITPEELKLELKKIFKPEEIKKLDAALEKLLQDKDFLLALNIKNLPKPTPKPKDVIIDPADRELERLVNNLYGLSCAQSGCIPVVVTCFIGNPYIVRQGPTLETEMTQIALPERTTDNTFGDSLGLNNEAVEKLEMQGVEPKHLEGEIRADLHKNPSLKPPGSIG